MLLRMTGLFLIRTVETGFGRIQPKELLEDIV